MNRDAALDHARDHRDRFLTELMPALSIPSVSTLSEHGADMQRMANWLAGRLSSAGLEHVTLLGTEGNPILYADHLHAPGKPTVLVYGHYDVQPADPLDEWDSPPFEPEIRGDYVFARGASDMKGQILAQLQAVEALLAVDALPVNLKYLIEGDEEIGSPPLPGFMARNKERLACDVVLNCDSGIHAPDQPSIVYSLRGLAYFEIEVTGPAQDLHSGVFGGSILNPINALCALLAGMHDADGRITLPEFYDKVRPLDEEERALLRRVPHSDAEWLAASGAPDIYGEAGYSTVERVGARPSLDINGIRGGFISVGAKTVLAARASAKFSMRLVPDQQGREAEAQLRAYLEAHVPSACRWTLKTHSMGPGAVMRRDSAHMRAAVDALASVFGREPFFKREGASVPVAGWVQELLHVDSIMLGFGLPNDNIHGPNERQYLPNLYKGIETYIHFLTNLGQ